VGRWEERVDGETKAGSSIDWNRKAAIVCTWKYRKGHSVLGRPRRPLGAVSHQV